MEFGKVQDILNQVIVESDVDNGTKGLVFTAHFWKEELVFNKDQHSLMGKLGSAWLNGDLQLFEKLSEEQSSIKPTQKMMTWAIVPAIPQIKGTKNYKEGSKMWKLKMDNVSKLYISENAVKLKLIVFEETDIMGKDAQGRETPILKMCLKKGIIDVAPPTVNWRGEEVVPKRAFVTPISFHALQIAGELKAGEDRKTRRRYGFDVEEIVS